jgi:hypothetical protein
MKRRLFERLTDTITFRVLHICAGLIVVPVLLLGIFGAGFALIALVSSSGDSGMIAVVLPVVGGVLGIVGWIRARSGVREPQGHDVSLTLVLLAFGVITAIVLAGCVVAATVAAAVATGAGSVAWASFVIALIIWAAAGVGSGQRLARVLAERTGRSVDALPALPLFLALALGLGASFGIAGL